MHLELNQGTFINLIHQLCPHHLKHNAGFGALNPNAYTAQGQFKCG